MRLSDRDFRSAMQLRLGLLEVLSAAIGLTCSCKRTLCKTDAEHALVCKLLSGAFTLRHNNLSRAASRADIASSKEPVPQQLQRQGHLARRRARGDGQRGDALLVLQEGVLAIDTDDRKRQIHAAQVTPQILLGENTQLKSAQHADAAAPAARHAPSPAPAPSDPPLICCHCTDTAPRSSPSACSQ